MYRLVLLFHVKNTINAHNICINYDLSSILIAKIKGKAACSSPEPDPGDERDVFSTFLLTTPFQKNCECGVQKCTLGLKMN
jgi:hypothetical protein